MDNNYFDFLGQNSVTGNDNTNAGDSNDKGKVNLTVRVDADCQVVCDGDFLFLANANQIVKDKAPMGQHLLNFTSLDYPDATIEKIVDFPVEGNNYLIVVNELKEKVEQFQKGKETEKQEKLRAAEEERLRQEQEQKRNVELDAAMTFYNEEKYESAWELFEKYIDYLSSEQQNTYVECCKHCKFKVILKNAGGAKLAIVRLVNELFGHGLEEAKELVDSVPTVVKKGVNKNDADKFRKSLEDKGAIVEIKVLSNDEKEIMKKEEELRRKERVERERREEERKMNWAAKKMDLIIPYFEKKCVYFGIYLKENRNWFERRLASEEDEGKFIVYDDEFYEHIKNHGYEYVFQFIDAHQPFFKSIGLVLKIENKYV